MNAQTLVDRQYLAAGLSAAGALIFGAIIGLSPVMGVALFGLAAVVALTLLFPVTHLCLLLVATLIIPYELQNEFSFGGGTGAGLILSDLLLLTGLTRGVIELAMRPLRMPQVALVLVTVVFLAAAVLQFWHGAFIRGAGLSEAGEELRRMFGFSAALIALPLLMDEEVRPRLLRGLLVVGFLLGIWGVVQWTFQFSYGEAGDVGVRQGVALTSGGTGQLQGGLYGFPVAVIVGFAALMSGRLTTVPSRVLVAAMTGLNGICALLTFERTFWVVTVLGCAYVVVRSGARERLRAILLAPLAVALVLVPMAALSPESLTTARERLFSLGQYGSDISVRYRVRESQQVIDEIRLRPLSGSGLGATVWWGRPDRNVLPSVNQFAHNGYLWITWKLGLPAAIVLFALIFWAIVRRGRVRGDPLFAMVAIGTQASLLALMVACVTFPSVAAKPITPTLGVLLAFAGLAHVRVRGRGRAAAVG